MRHLITLILFTSSWTAFGQSKSLTGTYSGTRTNNKLIFTIQNNGQFIADELMIEGKRRLTGTWTFQDTLIILKTNKIWSWDKRTNERKEYLTKDFPDTFISVDKQAQLTLLAPRDTEVPNIRLQKMK